MNSYPQKNSTDALLEDIGAIFLQATYFCNGRAASSSYPPTNRILIWEAESTVTCSMILLMKSSLNSVRFMFSSLLI